MQNNGGIKMEKKINVYLLCIINFLQGLIFYGPVATLYRQARGLNMYDIFMIESIFMVLLLLFEVPWGFFADKYGYKLTLVISNFLLFISKIVFFNAHSFNIFLLERVLLAIAFAGLSGCDIALLYSSVDNKKSERIFGVYSASSSAGFLIACLISSFIVSYSLDATAYISIFPSAAAALLTFFLKEVEVSKADRPSIKSSLKDLLVSRNILILVFASSLLMEISHSITVFLNQQQYIRSGISLSHFGIITALVQVTALASTKTHMLTKRIGQGALIKFLFAALSLSCLILVFTTNPILSVILVIIAGGSVSISQPSIMDIENKAISSNNRATMLSIYAMAGDILSALVNPIIGKAADRSLQTAFVVCLLLSTAALFLVVLFFKKCSEAPASLEVEN